MARETNKVDKIGFKNLFREHGNSRVVVIIDTCIFLLMKFVRTSIIFICFHCFFANSSAFVIYGIHAAPIIIEEPCILH